MNWLGWYMVMSPTNYPTSDWTISTPESEGVDSNSLIKGYKYIIDNKINAHSLLIIRNGKIVDETYFFPYQKDDMINIHSCTKSIISALVGIAIKEGYIKSVDQKILDFFPDKKIDNMSPEKQDITIRNLLTMSAGLAVKYPDMDMKSSNDWIQHVMDLKMSEKPGTKFNYSDATAHLLSAILQKTTGMSTYDYADTHLFQPMGIKVLWPADPQGINYGFGEINMTPRDMAKFGYLYLNKGKWDGKQLVPENWVKESTKRQFKTGLGDDYGYLWWCPHSGFKATGLGEQVIEVLPLVNTVIVSTNGLDDEQTYNFDPFNNAIKFINKSQNSEGYKTLKKLEQQFSFPKLEKNNLIEPSKISEISGKKYFFSKDNPLNLRELKIDFNKQNYTIIEANDFNGGQIEIKLPSDGSYIKDISRKSKNDTVFTRGFWQDDKTFVILLEASDRQLLFATFENNRLILKSVNRGQILFDNLVGIQELK